MRREPSYQAPLAASAVRGRTSLATEPAETLARGRLLGREPPCPTSARRATRSRPRRAARTTEDLDVRTRTGCRSAPSDPPVAVAVAPATPTRAEPADCTAVLDEAPAPACVPAPATGAETELRPLTRRRCCPAPAPAVPGRAPPALDPPGLVGAVVAGEGAALTVRDASRGAAEADPAAGAVAPSPTDGLGAAPVPGGVAGAGAGLATGATTGAGAGATTGVSAAGGGGGATARGGRSVAGST